jgi:hypothetical protein
MMIRINDIRFIRCDLEQIELPIVDNTSKAFERY